MKLTNLRIKNFRGLADIEFSTTKPLTVIVGPNAVGKTSLLEAIRLTKCLLMPTYLGEEQQVLTSLGAMSPHAPQLVNFEALAGDPKSDLEIRLGLKLSDADLDVLRKNVPRIASMHVRNMLGLPQAQDQFGLVQFLSSPLGKTQVAKATTEIMEKLGQVAQSRTVTPTLQIEASSLQTSGKDLLDQELVTVLGRSLPPHQGLISYFPADRAMPAGEVNIQLGGPDIQQQIYSHLGQPSTKYQRLKHYIVNQSLMGVTPRQDLENDFSLVFEKLLPGKSLDKTLSLSPAGALSIRIRDSSGVYDIDAMSSGEKGLLLTFLLLRRTCAPGGLVLLDEPELHLNPSVTKKLLPFLMDDILKPNDLQAIVCTHSPEMLVAAYEHAECSLLHLRSGRDISPILPQDKAEVYEALRRLGAQTSDLLSMRGCIFVEGTHDAELLETGFAQRTSGFKVTKLGGRGEVEKEIKTLQVPEKEKELTSIQCFIFDNDRKLTGLKSTKMVRVGQWDRYCFENYLLDPDVIFDVFKALKAGRLPDSRGELRQQMKELALAQIKGVMAREEYDASDFENPGLRPAEVDPLKDYKAIGDVLANRISKIQQQVSEFSRQKWASEFEKRCSEKEKPVIEDWKETWMVKCDGKRLLSDLHRAVQANVPLLDFKRRIISEMAVKRTETWKTIDSTLDGILSKDAG